MSDVGFRVQDFGFRVWSFMFWKEISSAGRPPGRHCKTQKTLAKRSESQHLRAAPPSWPYNYIYICIYVYVCTIEWAKSYVLFLTEVMHRTVYHPNIFTAHHLSGTNYGCSDCKERNGIAPKPKAVPNSIVFYEVSLSFVPKAVLALGLQTTCKCSYPTGVGTI